MLGSEIILPTEPKVVKEEGNMGVYEIDGLYPGYGHTLGNSLRRVILSSLSGTAITRVKIDDVPHEFTTIPGIKEDAVNILLNLKRLCVEMISGYEQEVSLRVKGVKTVTGKDIESGSQIKILNPEQVIATLTDSKSELNMEITIERGIGYRTRENLQKDRVEIGAIVLDANFSPIVRVNYEVEDSRVADRTDFNKLTMFIETDGTITPRQALEDAIRIMIQQLSAIVHFQGEEEIETVKRNVVLADEEPEKDSKDLLKTRIEDLDLSNRTKNALVKANIKTIGGLTNKTEDEIKEIDGIADKGVTEIKNLLKDNGFELKK